MGFKQLDKLKKNKQTLPVAMGWALGGFLKPMAESNPFVTNAWWNHVGSCV